MSDVVSIPAERVDDFLALIADLRHETRMAVEQLEARYPPAQLPSAPTDGAATDTWNAYRAVVRSSLEGSWRVWDLINDFLNSHGIAAETIDEVDDLRLADALGEVADLVVRLSRYTRPERTPDARPAVPNVFALGNAALPTNHATYALMQAIQSSVTEWDDADGNTVPTYTMVTNKGSKFGPGRVTVSVRPAPGESRPGDVLPALWQSVRELDDLCSDVLLVCLAQWSSLARGPRESVRITADAILDARGIKRMHKSGESGNWQHGHRTDDRVAAGRALAQLGSLWLEVTNVGVGLKTKLLSRITIESSPALAIVGLREQPDAEGRRVLLDATVMPGDWARTYWELGLHQTAVLAQKALNYDVKYHRAEKRIAKYLAFAFRWNAHRDADTIRLRVGTLLAHAEIKPDQRRPIRARESLDRALKRLTADGVIGGWSYVVDPDTSLPPRGWLTHWLAMTISIDPPTIVVEQYARLKPKAGKTARKMAAQDATLRGLMERLDHLDGGAAEREI